MSRHRYFNALNNKKLLNGDILEREEYYRNKNHISMQEELPKCKLCGTSRGGRYMHDTECPVRTNVMPATPEEWRTLNQIRDMNLSR